jgi:hypothetical protein
VGLQPGGKIALFGSIFMRLKSSEERQIAHLVRQLGGLLANGVHNRRNANKHQGEGLISRISAGVITMDKLPSGPPSWERFVRGSTIQRLLSMS